MSDITWSQDLVLDHPQMDATHREFIDLMVTVDDALKVSNEAALTAWEQAVEHTVVHFGTEDRWMQATGFAPENCHTSQHQQVLAIMQEVARLAREQGDFSPLQRVVPELVAWFNMHVQTMDSSLSVHLQTIGFDPVTGQCSQPLEIQQAITGCGGSSCSPAEHGTTASAC
jgi:hemerythrin